MPDVTTIVQSPPPPASRTVKVTEDPAVTPAPTKNEVPQMAPDVVLTEAVLVPLAFFHVVEDVVICVRRVDVLLLYRLIVDAAEIFAGRDPLPAFPML